MRLLFVCPDMRTGGAERHWATLSPELHDRGTAVKLLALADAGPFFDDVVARGVPAECLHLQRHTNPRARPLPEEWEEALIAAEKALVSCSQGHLYSRHLADCPVCQAEADARDDAEQRHDSRELGAP